MSYRCPDCRAKRPTKAESIFGVPTCLNCVRTIAYLDALNLAMKLCGHGMTTGMIRKLLHNKFVEISGEGEKA